MGSFFILNLFIGVIIDNFNRLKQQVSFVFCSFELITIFNKFIYLFQHRVLHYNLHYLHNFTYIIDKTVLKWTTLQYNIWTTYNTVLTLVTILYNFSFFSLNTIFSTMNIVSATTNTLLLTIYTQSKTQDQRTQNKGGGNILYYLKSHIEILWF